MSVLSHFNVSDKHQPLYPQDTPIEENQAYDNTQTPEVKTIYKTSKNLGDCIGFIIGIIFGIISISVFIYIYILMQMKEIFFFFNFLYFFNWNISF